MLFVIKVIDQCENCNRNQLAPVISHPAIAIPVINIFDRINIDLVFGLTEVDDYVGIFIVTEALTKYVYAVEIKTKTAAECAGKLWAYISQFGPPNTIISDQGKEWVNTIIREMLKAVGIDHRVTAAYKPSTNGAAEKANQVIIQALRKSTYENPYDWPKWIPFVLLAYRTKVHETTKYTPFELMFGRKVNKFEEWSSEANDDEVEQINNRAKQIKHLVKQTQVLALTNIKKAQETQKRDQNNANKTVCEILPKGSKVYIKNENKVKKKLDPRYSGPFIILEYTKENNYIIEN